MRKPTRSAPLVQQGNVFETALGRSRTAAEMAKRLKRAALASSSQMAYEKALKIEKCSEGVNNWAEVTTASDKSFKRAGAFYACRVPFCPNCSSGRSREIRKKARKLVASLDHSSTEKPRLITLTGPIVKGASFDLLAHIYLRAFELLRKRKWWKLRVSSGIRVLEFTITNEREIHAHLHVLAASRFMSKDEFCSVWSECLLRAWEEKGVALIISTITGKALVDVRLINDNTSDTGPDLISPAEALNKVANYICKGSTWARMKDEHLLSIAEKRLPRLYESFGSSRNTRATNTSLDTKQINDGRRRGKTSQPFRTHAGKPGVAAVNDIGVEEHITQQVERTRRFRLAPVSALPKDKSFLLELERVVKDFSASPYIPETSSFHPAFVELLATPFRQDQQRVINHLRPSLMLELLRPFEDGMHSFKMESRSWSSLQRVKKSTQLCKIIIEWSKYLNLDADWCRDFAVVALCEWLSERSSRWDEHYISFDSAIAEIRMNNIWTAHTAPLIGLDEDVDALRAFIDISSSDTHFCFSWRGIDFQTSRWNPLVKYRDEWASESEQEFISYLTRRIESGDIVPTGALKRFREARDKYLREIERVAPLAGLIKTPRRWAKEHLEWAARFQVQKWPLSKIEGAYSKPRKTVADGINRTIDFIGLARRPNLRPGMPKGTRLSAKRRIVRN